MDGWRATGGARLQACINDVTSRIVILSGAASAAKSRDLRFGCGGEGQSVIGVLRLRVRKVGGRSAQDDNREEKELAAAGEKQILRLRRAKDARLRSG